MNSASGSLSLLGSLTIIYVLMNSKSRLDTCHRRLVFGMSLADVISSSIFALCLVPRPTQLACSIQGFLLHIGVSTTPMYNASLCIYYVASVFFEKNEVWIRKKLEPFLHLIPILLNLCAAIFLVTSGTINEAGPVCWVASKPLDCLEDPNVECERGIKAAQYRYIFIGYQTFINFFVIVVSMIMLCCKVAKQERKMSETNVVGRFSDTTTMEDDEEMPSGQIRMSVTADAYRNPTRTRSQKRKVVKQASVYVAAYFLPFLFPSVHYIYKSFAGRRSFALWITMSFFLPLQGLFNAMVFLRPRIAALRQKHEDVSSLKLFLATIKVIDLDKSKSRKNNVSWQLEANSF